MTQRQKQRKLLAAASVGGHWIQLLRITDGLRGAGCHVDFLSTNRGCARMIPSDSRFYHVRDFSRTDFWRLVPAFFEALKAVWKSRPDTVITTGAAPGLVVALAARCLLRRVIWIDSIANVEHLSLCGRVASKFVTATFTQWPELAGGRVRYAGNVLGDSSETLSSSSHE